MINITEYQQDERLLALADRIDEYVDGLGARVMYGTEPVAQQLERDVLWAVNSLINGDGGHTWMRSHRAAMRMIAQLLRYNVVPGENLTDSKLL